MTASSGCVKAMVTVWSPVGCELVRSCRRVSGCCFLNVEGPREEEEERTFTISVLFASVERMATRCVQRHLW